MLYLNGSMLNARRYNTIECAQVSSYMLIYRDLLPHPFEI